MNLQAADQAIDLWTFIMFIYLMFSTCLFVLENTGEIPGLTIEKIKKTLSCLISNILCFYLADFITFLLAGL